MGNDFEIAEPFGCPACGETHTDKLVWDDAGESVTCTTCGTVYNPNEN